MQVVTPPRTLASASPTRATTSTSEQEVSDGEEGVALNFHDFLETWGSKHGPGFTTTEDGAILFQGSSIKTQSPILKCLHCKGLSENDFCTDCGVACIYGYVVEHSLKRRILGHKIDIKIDAYDADIIPHGDTGASEIDEDAMRTD